MLLCNVEFNWWKVEKDIFFYHFLQYRVRIQESQIHGDPGPKQSVQKYVPYILIHATLRAMLLSNFYFLSLAVLFEQLPNLEALIFNTVTISYTILAYVLASKLATPCQLILHIHISTSKFVARFFRTAYIFPFFPLLRHHSSVR